MNQTVLLFILSFAVMIPICSFVWETCVDGRIYNCTDSTPFDFLFPGNWVHGQAQSMSRIEPSGNMSNPDTILEGWTNADLRKLWFLFLSSALLASLSISCVGRKYLNRAIHR